MKGMLIGLALLLCACSSPGDKAADEYEMMTEMATMPDETCAKAREVADAYLQSQDRDGYKKWRITADLECARADLLLM